VTAIIRDVLDEWRGSGSHSLAVPPMDGALWPNQAIEEAPALLSVEAPDNLTSDGKRILFSSKATISELKINGIIATAAPVMDVEAPVTAMAMDSSGCLAIGVNDGRVMLRGGKHDGKTLIEVGDRPIVCPTALLFTDVDTLLLSLGSRQNAPENWKHDLMQRNASGSVWRLDLTAGTATCLGDKLAYPYGLFLAEDRSVIVSESWRNRLIRITSPNAKPTIQLTDITGYPARLSKASADGGAWLAVFAPRNQLVEFVLREKDYRTQMIAEVPNELWIAPSLCAPQTLLEPLQVGALKQLGTLKPWAPSRSYGLIVQLDDMFEPRGSLHSRADGRRHGITSCMELDGRVIATSKGGDVILSVPLTSGEA
jgi:Strictosidine synthase